MQCEFFFATLRHRLPRICTILMSIIRLFCVDTIFCCASYHFSVVHWKYFRDLIGIDGRMALRYSIHQSSHQTTSLSLQSPLSTKIWVNTRTIWNLKGESAAHCSWSQMLEFSKNAWACSALSADFHDIVGIYATQTRFSDNNPHLLFLELW